MIFIKNKYTFIYYSIINRAKSRNLPTDVYKERHHIIPKSLGGSDDIDNLVYLTGREHLICHLLLVRITTGVHKSKMVHAAWGMANLENDLQKRKKLNSRQYEILKEQFSKIHSVRMTLDNPMHDPEIKERHQSAIDKRGRTSGMTGKKHRPETKIKLHNANKGQFVPESKRREASEFHLNRPPEIQQMYKERHSSNICCIYCHKLSNPGTFKRWHGDNCKMKDNLVSV